MNQVNIDAIINQRRREFEAAAYREFIDLSQAITCEYRLCLTVKRDTSCSLSVTRGQFIEGLNGLYMDKRDASWPDFLATGIKVVDYNAGIVLTASNKGAIIGVITTLKKYAKGTGFTFTL